MSSPDFDNDYEDLLAALDEAVALLRTYGRNHWADWLEGDRDQIARGDKHALDHLLSAFGGMGSLNDLIIHPLNGDSITESAIDPANKRLNTYRNQIWTAARAMQRELDR